MRISATDNVALLSDTANARQSSIAFIDCQSARPACWIAAKKGAQR
jgi:hypothetical protein